MGASTAELVGDLSVTSGSVSLGGTLAGNVAVSAGTLTLSSDNVIGDTNTVAVSGTGEFNLGGHADEVGAVTMSGGAIANGTLTSSGFTFTGGASTAELVGDLSVTSGSVSLGGTLAGNVAVSAGTLTLSSDNVIGDTNTVAVSGTGEFNLGGDADEVGAVTMSGGAIANGTLTSSGFTFTGGASTAELVGDLSVTSGSVSLGGTLAGNVAVSAVTLTLSSDNVIGDTNTVAVSGTGEFNLGGHADEVGAVTMSGGAIANGTLTSSGLTFTAGASPAERWGI